MCKFCKRTNGKPRFGPVREFVVRLQYGCCPVFEGVYSSLRRLRERLCASVPRGVQNSLQPLAPLCSANISGSGCYVFPLSRAFASMDKLLAGPSITRRKALLKPCFAYLSCMAKARNAVFCLFLCGSACHRVASFCLSVAQCSARCR